VPLYHFRDAGLDEHLYTPDAAEAAAQGRPYRNAGVIGYVYRTGGPDRVALHRYFDPARTDHFYTADFAEIGTGQFGYAYQGVCCYLLRSAAGPPA
jgi:hypothetical protein